MTRTIEIAGRTVVINEEMPDLLKVRRQRLLFERRGRLFPLFVSKMGWIDEG